MWDRYIDIVYILWRMYSFGLIVDHTDTDNLSQTLLIEWVIFTLFTFAGLDDFTGVTLSALTSL